MKDDRIDVLVTHPFDWSKVNGCTIKDAIKYLQKIANDLPDDACIDEHWTGYEDMEIRVISYRKETDGEYFLRKDQEERDRKYREEQKKREAEREKRRKEYLRLKREFG